MNSDGERRNSVFYKIKKLPIFISINADITREMGAKLGDQAANLSLIPNK